MWQRHSGGGSVASSSSKQPGVTAGSAGSAATNTQPNVPAQTLSAAPSPSPVKEQPQESANREQLEYVDPKDIVIREQKDGKEVVETLIGDAVVLKEENLSRPSLMAPVSTSTSSSSLPTRIPLWKAEYLLNGGLSESLCKKVLLHYNMEMSVGAEECLSRGIQVHFRSLIDNAMTYSRRRRNRNCVQSYNNVSTVLNKNKGEVIPELRMNVGMKWGPDNMEIIREESQEQAKLVAAAVATEEKALVEEMREFDERQKEKGKKMTVDGEELWWERDEKDVCERNLSWEQLAMALFRDRVASQHLVGQYSKKRPRQIEKENVKGKSKKIKDKDKDKDKDKEKEKEKEKEEKGKEKEKESGSMDVDEQCSEKRLESTTSLPSSTASASASASQPPVQAVPKNMMPPSLDVFVPIPCPLGSKTAPDTITLDDVSMVLRPLSRPKAGGPFSAAIGSSFTRISLLPRDSV